MKRKSSNESRLTQLACTVGVAFLAMSTSVHAADFPTKPVRMICAHVVGGAVDIFARILSQKMSEGWNGQQIIVENRAGAAGAVAAQAVAKAAPDGYTIMLSTNSPLTTNPYLYKSLGYDYTDFEPIVLVAEGAVAVIYNPALPVKTVQELIAYAKQNPGKLSTASAGSGSLGHFLVAELKREYGMELVHVPYKGGVPAAAAVASGEVQLGFIDPGASAPFMRENRIRALAVTSSRRSSTIPDIPTLKELGVPGFEVAAWVAMTGPKGIPKDVVNKINADARAALRDPVVRQRLIASGVEPIDGGSPADLGDFMRKEAPRWQQRVKDAALKVD